MTPVGILTLVAAALFLEGQHTVASVRLDGAGIVLVTVALLRVVLSTRVDPPFPLSRLRARSQLLEVRTEQLSCTDTEVADFLREIVGVELSGAEIEQVANRTGGWLAGLQRNAPYIPGAGSPEFYGAV